METLTLKELAPYLPYGLKVIWSDGKIDTINSKLSEKNNEENEVSLQLALYAFEIPHNYLKPILYPLDYLTKPITHNGETFVPSDRTMVGMQHGRIYKNIGIVQNRLNTNTIFYNDMVYLLSLRFDVFNLINRGLAIPITETFNPYK